MQSQKPYEYWEIFEVQGLVILKFYIFKDDHQGKKWSREHI